MRCGLALAGQLREVRATGNGSQPGCGAEVPGGGREKRPVSRPERLFTLTGVAGQAAVKTLTSLRFALDHAQCAWSAPGS